MVRTLVRVAHVMPVTEVSHPLVQHKLSYLRDQDTPTVHFRKLVEEVTLLLTYEATKDLPTEQVEIETPLERAPFPRISGKKVAVCPILRAGLGMLDGVLTLISGARVGFIGLYRDEETLQPVEYYVKLPQDVADRDVILLDPMLATGNSTAHAVKLVKDAGASSVSLISIIAAPEGIENIQSEHPDVQIVVAAIDRQLNEGVTSFPGSATRETASTARSRFLDGLETADRPPRGRLGRARGAAIVLVLTPAVGRAARYLRLADRPRKATAPPRDPATRRPCALFRGLRPVDRVPPARRRVAGRPAGRERGDDRRRGRRLPRSQLVAEARRPDPGSRHSHDVRGLGAAVHVPVVGIHALPAWFGVPLTVVGIVAVMNMVNFLDGLDGLAAGVCAISGATFCVIELSLGRIGAATLAAIVCGACVGFLHHNFYPARIFMGDSGALLLGYTLGAIAVQGS